MNNLTRNTGSGRDHHGSLTGHRAFRTSLTLPLVPLRG